MSGVTGKGFPKRSHLARKSKLNYFKNLFFGEKQSSFYHANLDVIQIGK
jgi:hypothetical protein